LIAFGILFFALLVSYTPERIPNTIQDSIQAVTEQFSTGRLLLAAGVIAGMYAVVASWVRRTTDVNQPFPETEPNAVTRDIAVIGAALTAEFDQRRTELSDSTQLEDEAIKSELRTVLVSLYTRKLGSRDAAREYIDTGDWTDDSYAAAFLTNSTAVDYPLLHRLYAWVYPGLAYETRVQRALHAVESAYAAYDAQYEQPTHNLSKGQRLQAVLHKTAETLSTENT
jgi:hypothetical protein